MGSDNLPSRASAARDYSRLGPTAFQVEWTRGLSILVIGAGAIGNEVIKNLALLGVGSLTIVDPDVIEPSNLTRSVLFCGPDVSRDLEARTPKARLAARRTRELNPDVNAVPLERGVADVGLQIFRDADIVLGCLDNERARLETSWAAWRTDTPFVDAGLGLVNYSSGQVSIFPGGDGPCYLCRKALAKRRELLQEMRGIEDPCWRKGADARDAGFIVTTPLTASAIAALQVELALRHLRQPASRTEGFAVRLTLHPGPTMDSGGFARSASCPLHDPVSRIESCQSVESDSDSTSPADLFARAGLAAPVLRLDWPMVVKATCRSCGATTTPFVRLTVVRNQPCTSCGKRTLAAVDTLTAIEPESPWANSSLRALGLPARHVHEVVSAQSPGERVHFALVEDDAEGPAC